MVCQGQSQFFHQGPPHLLGQLPVDSGKPVALPPFPQGEQFRRVIPRLFLGGVFPFAVGDGAFPQPQFQAVHRGPKIGGGLLGAPHRQGKQPQIVAHPGFPQPAHHLAAGLGGELLLEHLMLGAGGEGEPLLFPVACERVFHGEFHPDAPAGKRGGVPHFQLEGDGFPFAGILPGGGCAVPLAGGKLHPGAEHPRQGTDQGNHRQQQGEHKDIQGEVPVKTDEERGGPQQYKEVAKPAFPHEGPSFRNGWMAVTPLWAGGRCPTLR